MPTRRTKLVGLIAALVVAVAGACTDSTAPNLGAAPPLLNGLPRKLTDSEDSVVSAGNKFTIELFKQASAAEPGKNVFLSPLSASLSLGMAMNGARNATFDAMRTALQFGSVPQDDINASYKSLMDLLLGLDPSTETKIANAIWYRNTFPVRPEFVATAQDFFSAEVWPLDFRQEASSIETINQWVSDKTAGRIPSILDRIDDADVMFLINAIYFKATWRNAFDIRETAPADFRRGDGTTESVPMMHLAGEGYRGEVWPDGTKAIQLPYGNGAFDMQVYLPPDTSSIESFVTRLDDRITMNPGSEVSELQFWMPRVKLEYKRELAPDLASLGMGMAFGEAADFSGLTTAPMPLAISSVLQKTFLSIDEQGTEAAAVTKTDIFVTTNQGPQPLTMRCDRPYLVVIRERFSHTILFVGKINTI